MAYINRGNAHRDSEQLERAAADYGEVIKLAPADARGWRNRGMIRLYQGDTKGGLADYDKALQYDPADAYSWNNRGQARMRLGDKAGAIADFARRLRSAPACVPQARACNGSVQRNRAHALRPCGAQDRCGRALRAGARLLRVPPRHTPPMRPDLVRYRKCCDRGPLTYASLQGGYYVGLSFLQYTSNVGRLVRHAAWRADRGLAMVSVLLS
jgi:tetratricopeptide (TPR) repeat protein